MTEKKNMKEQHERKRYKAKWNGRLSWALWYVRQTGRRWMSGDVGCWGRYPHSLICNTTDMHRSLISNTTQMTVEPTFEKEHHKSLTACCRWYVIGADGMWPRDIPHIPDIPKSQHSAFYSIYTTPLSLRFTPEFSGWWIWTPVLLFTLYVRFTLELKGHNFRIVAEVT